MSPAYLIAVRLPPYLGADSVFDATHQNAQYALYNPRQREGARRQCPGPAQLGRYRLEEHPESIMHPLGDHHDKEASYDYYIAIKKSLSGIHCLPLFRISND